MQISCSYEYICDDVPAAHTVGCRVVRAIAPGLLQTLKELKKYGFATRLLVLEQDRPRVVELDGDYYGILALESSASNVMGPVRIAWSSLSENIDLWTLGYW